MSQLPHWDPATAAVVESRLAPPPAPRFFSPAEEATATALLNLILGQDEEPRVPVTAMIDARLAEAQTDGWRYADMPEDGQAWRDTLAYLDADAQVKYAAAFAECPAADQRALIHAVQDLGSGDWHGLPASRVWSLWTRYACTAFYAHPWAWNEMGFPGPAYPRGYKNKGVGRREPFEVADSAGRGPGPGGRMSTQVRQRNESAWLLPNDGTRTNHQLRRDMRRFDDTDEIDLVIVGCGAGGSVMLQRLARAGWRVAALDAGPFWDPDTDWFSDEAASHHLYWTEPRVITGTDPVPLGSNNSGRGVGGSMVHYAGYTPRFHPSDFRTFSQDGVGADWPLSYGDLRPYYAAIEEELPVAGEHWPWGDPHGYPHRPHPVGGNGEVFLRGARKLGITAKVGPVAIPNGRFGNRPHCIYRGFCLQGCKVNAKASPLISHIPDALAHGGEVRADAMVTRIAVDERTGRATGVHYVRGGRERFQRARMVAVAGYSIETPRLLLNSSSSRFPDGLCNDFDQVGRYLMVQGAPQTAGRFDDEVRMYKAPPPEVSSEDFYETDPAKPYRRGFSIQNVSPLPITWAEHVAAQGHWGRALRDYMSDYVHWCCLGALCEFLPQADNRITLDEETDRHGLPVARFSYSQCDNDTQLLHAAQRVMEDMLHAAGADEVITIQRFAHLVGGARMAADERHGVVDGTCRSFAVPNLYITDGSVLPTQGSANPALTIMAVAARAAGLLRAGARGGSS